MKIGLAEKLHRETSITFGLLALRLSSPLLQRKKLGNGGCVSACDMGGQQRTPFLSSGVANPLKAIPRLAEGLAQEDLAS